MRRLADQHRTAVAQLEHESLQLKHQLLRGLYEISTTINRFYSLCQCLEPVGDRLGTTPVV